MQVWLIRWEHSTAGELVALHLTEHDALVHFDNLSHKPYFDGGAVSTAWLADETWCPVNV